MKLSVQIRCDRAGTLIRDSASVSDVAVVHGSREEVKAKIEIIVLGELVIARGDVSETLMRALIPVSPLCCAFRMASCLASDLGAKDG